MIAYIFFVSEAEYPKLQSVCHDDFPFTYAQFAARVDEGIAQMQKTATLVKTNVRVDEFIAWCTQAKVKPNNVARSRYATIVGQANSLH